MRWVGFLLAMAWTSSASAQLYVDASKVVGRVRPLHGVNCGPLVAGGMTDLSADYRDLRIPLVRLHDCQWPSPDVVDIAAIFPNPDADPKGPKSYRFARTDEYLKATLDTGAKVVYRLGESIEHTKVKHRVNPPGDPARWAEVCVGIIRHYNEGWADGHRYGITHWEIWNEPENKPVMWTGTDEQFLELYGVAAKRIRKEFPHLKVGGPSFGYTGKIEGRRFVAGDYLVRFLDHCRDAGIPLDFFSWHLYTDDPAECLVRARGIRALLDERGFKSTEVHFNEWNYLPHNDWKPVMAKGQGVARERFYEEQGGPAGAAFAVATLSNLQDAPVDAANFFKGEVGGFALHNEHGTPKKVFYSFKAFRMLAERPVRVESGGGDSSKLTICAGMDEGRSELRVLVANYRAEQKGFTLRVSGHRWADAVECRAWVVDGGRSLEAVPAKCDGGVVRFELPAPGVILLQFTEARQ